MAALQNSVSNCRGSVNHNLCVDVIKIDNLYLEGQNIVLEKGFIFSLSYRALLHPSFIFTSCVLNIFCILWRLEE